jgi:hypothetical protein
MENAATKHNRGDAIDWGVTYSAGNEFCWLPQHLAKFAYRNELLASVRVGCAFRYARRVIHTHVEHRFLA